MVAPRLKVDFHVHTSEDPKDRDIRYSAKQLLDAAAEYQFDVITIANHAACLASDELRRYAEARGILLIPGVEAYVEGKHVVIVNCHQPYREGLTFETVRAYAGEQALIIAPHPFYPQRYCLKDQLEHHIAVFDAIEYAHLHFRFLNFNRRAVEIAHKYDVPLVGTSDAHELRQLNTTYSLIEAEKDVSAIIDAVRHHRVEVVTHPLGFWEFLKAGCEFGFSSAKKLFRHRDQDVTHNSE
ncbi:hypothetical protein GF339_06030 [candidate division KSB3 bacterium]|uniref:Polymerase/histidinol phosphatase N-terminal domain-containing protein n=1 Tax=candidate division KSB3 bacterium TaxID=2044937 RepID=A0A9D5JTV2_9BACT|nr:hypothetical protein [candidate division KSB3 bacterium]MBD3324122.1 hypothetical protein [candidate division KSB3 bacterium]